MFLKLIDRMGMPALVNLAQVTHISCGQNRNTHLKFFGNDGMHVRHSIEDITLALETHGYKVTELTKESFNVEQPTHPGSRQHLRQGGPVRR